MVVMSRLRNAETLQNSLRKIFASYASYSTKGSQSFIRIQRFLMLMEDAGVPDEQLGIKQLEMVFLRENKQKPSANFQMFLEILTQVARQKYRSLFDVKPGQAFLTLTEECLIPLLSRVIEQEIGPVSRLAPVRDDCKALLISVFEPMMVLYQAYFPWEIQAQQVTDVLTNRSWQALGTFMREFDVCPTVVSKGTVAQLWREMVILQDSSQLLAATVLPDAALDLGKSFTLSRFIMLLLQAAERGYADDISSKSTSATEKLLILLERMQMSKGLESLEKRIGVSLGLRGSIAPPSHLVHQVLYPNSAENYEEYSEQSVHSSMISDEPVSESVLSLSPEALLKLDPFLERVQHIFQAYCSFGDPMNTTRLKPSNYLRLLKDCGVIRTEDSRFSKAPLMEPIEVDLLFTRLAGVNKKARPSSSTRSATSWRVFTFSQFLKSLESIAMRLYPESNLENAYLSFIQENVLTLENDWNDERGVSSSNIKQLIQLLKSEEMIEVLILVHKSLLYFYKHYSEPRGLMNFDGFIRFCKDFNMFPDLVSKSKLLRLFTTMAAFHAQTEQPQISVSSRSSRTSQSKGDVIDEHLFVETLALVANEVVYPEPEPGPVEKVCLLMERMNQSSGPKTVLLATGHNRAGMPESDDLLCYLRDRFSYIFTREPINTKLGFDAVLSSLQG
jgi:hypothetical protein